ncbi:hypothetical protein [Vibrio phage JSF12]|uniref:Uncharacterized protein n=3 Tax=Jesfedecavirus TaxID=2560156 RepID=A0A2D0Z1C9_9CAUD|nr:hypothetical protein AVV29_gp131 [Vibrio phage phi 3]YP_009618440.1 hypothetical protein FDI98_gp119 [Vibrio phage JSF10]YP_009794699.1 hypothetical protein HOS35_gp016 [Vibrio phage JSF12]AJF40847.1 hypothetical protein SBVP3_0080 [Vibrio phage phi 3]ASV43413.1 hypothetical protein [Vibrio phage JSF10]ASV43534.1 hypothetical protein [Vibrio phage JSF12]
MSKKAVWTMIRLDDLYSLVHDSLLLQHLENEGVDNWTGYYHPENLDEQAKEQVDKLKREYLKNVKSTSN